MTFKLTNEGRRNGWSTKPHFWLRSGGWYCSGRGCVGFGFVLSAAYRRWEDEVMRDMEKMHGYNT